MGAIAWSWRKFFGSGSNSNGAAVESTCPRYRSNDRTSRVHSSNNSCYYVYYGPVNYVNHVENATFGDSPYPVPSPEPGNEESSRRVSPRTVPPNAFVIFSCSMIRCQCLADSSISNPDAMASITCEAWDRLGELDRAKIEDDALRSEALHSEMMGSPGAETEVARQKNKYWTFAAQLAEFWREKWNQVKGFVVERAKALAEELRAQPDLGQSSSSDARRLALHFDPTNPSPGKAPWVFSGVSGKRKEPLSALCMDDGLRHPRGTGPKARLWCSVPPNAFVIFSRSMVRSHGLLGIKIDDTDATATITCEAWRMLNEADREKVEDNASRSEELHSAMVGSEVKGIGAAKQKGRYWPFVARVAEFWVEKWNEVKGFIVENMEDLAQAFCG